MGKWLFPRQIFARCGARVEVGVLGFVCAGVASAQAPVEDYAQFEITPFFGYMAGGQFKDPIANTDRDLDEGNSFGVIFNAAADRWRHYELLYAKQGSRVDGADPFDLDVEYLQIGGTVSSEDARHVIPYFGITVGAARFSPDRSGYDTETKLAFSVAGGVKVPITDHLGVRFDARAFPTLIDGDSDIFCVSTNGAGACRIRTKSDTFLQYSAALGLTVAF